MTSFGAMLRSDAGKTSTSFLIVVALVLMVLGGYAGWRVFRPNPFRQSEQVVRSSRSHLNDRVRDFQQEFLEVMSKPGLTPPQRMAEIEKKADAAKRDIDAFRDEALGQLAELDIPLKTHENRAARLAEKADAAKSMIDSRVDEKRDQLTDS